MSLKIKTVTRVEKHNINKNSEMFKIIDSLCYKSKNLYNYANYIIRHEFIKNGKYISYYDMKKELKTHEPFKELGSQAAQQTLSILDRSWKSFFYAIKDWSKNRDKYLGKPNIPRYRNKNGRCAVIISNIQFKRENNYIRFSWKPLRPFKVFTKTLGKLLEIRFTPKGSHYTMEIVYEISVPVLKTKSNRVVGIDLGINNFATVSNNIGVKPFIVNGKVIKSINQYYNKKRSELQSSLMLKHNKQWSNKLRTLTDKRNNKVSHFIHKSSKYIVKWCKNNNVDTIVIGRNKTWKQNVSIGKRNNQNFTFVPFERFISTLKYKAENVGIEVIETEESYTSGTSFLDGELPIKRKYDRSRRVSRGLFKSKKGNLINADLNGAYQIIKKVFPKAFENGIEGAYLHPVRVNII